MGGSNASGSNARGSNSTSVNRVVLQQPATNIICNRLKHPTNSNHYAHTPITQVTIRSTQAVSENRAKGSELEGEWVRHPRHGEAYRPANQDLRHRVASRHAPPHANAHILTAPLGAVHQHQTCRADHHNPCKERHLPRLPCSPQQHVCQKARRLRVLRRALPDERVERRDEEESEGRGSSE